MEIIEFEFQLWRKNKLSWLAYLTNGVSLKAWDGIVVKELSLRSTSTKLISSEKAPASTCTSRELERWIFWRFKSPADLNASLGNTPSLFPDMSRTWVSGSIPSGRLSNPWFRQETWREKILRVNSFSKLRNFLVKNMCQLISLSGRKETYCNCTIRIKWRREKVL